MDELSSKLGIAGIAGVAISGRFGSWARYHAQQLAEANEREIWEYLNGQRHPYNVAIAVAVNYPFSAEDLEPLARLADSNEALLREGLEKGYELVRAGHEADFVIYNLYKTVLRFAWVYLSEKRREADEVTMKRLLGHSLNLQPAHNDKPQKPSRAERRKRAREWRKQSRQR